VLEIVKVKIIERLGQKNSENFTDNVKSALELY